MRLESHDEVEFAQALPQKAFTLGVYPDACVNKNGSEFYKKLRTSFQQRTSQSKVRNSNLQHYATGEQIGSGKVSGEIKYSP